MSSINARYNNRKIVDEGTLLSDVNPSLRADIHMHVCNDLVKTVPIFQACRGVVVRVLVPNLMRQVYPPGELIFQQVMVHPADGQSQQVTLKAHMLTIYAGFVWTPLVVALYCL